MTIPQIQLQGVSKRYNANSAALKSIDFGIDASAKLGIVGETGSGKSTLLRLIAGLEQPDSGVILFEGEKVDGPLEKLVPGHKDIIYLSQYSDLPKFVTVEQHLDNTYHLTDQQALEINRACEIEHLIDKDTSELSGGERQRVSFAKALTQTPKVLLLDEPFSNLDLIHKKALKEVVDTISKRFQTTVIMVTHDARDVLPWADKVMVFKEGTIVQQGEPCTIYKKPISEYVAGLFGDYNLVPEGIFGDNSSKKHRISQYLFLRPEELFLHQEAAKDSIACKVNRIQYLGTHYGIELLSDQGLMISTVSNKKVAIASKVWISLNH